MSPRPVYPQGQHPHLMRLSPAQKEMLSRQSPYITNGQRQMWSPQQNLTQNIQKTANKTIQTKQKKDTNCFYTIGLNLSLSRENLRHLLNISPVYYQFDVEEQLKGNYLLKKQRKEED